MKIKTAILAGVLVAGLPVAVQAQDVESYENYQVSCQSGADCNNFDVNYEQQPNANDEISQRTRERRTRSSSLDSKYYAGGNIGLFLPGGDADAGFGLGGLFGYKFTENLSAELEVFDYFGGTETDDLNYNLLGIAANGVYKYPFGSDSNSPYAFGGAGIGIGVSNLSGDVADAADDVGVDTSGTGFLFQGKVGAGYPLGDKIDLIGQVRYVNVSSDYAVGGVSGVDDAFSIDLGATYKF